MKRFSVLMIAFVLTGCMTPEQIAARNQQIELNKQQYCANLGAPLGSPLYYDCRKSLEERLEAEVLQRRYIQQQQWREYQEQQQQSSQALMNGLLNMRSNRMRCSTTALGNSLDTTCY